MKIKQLLILVSILLPVKLLATTWGDFYEIDDPIVKSAKCMVKSPGSYGSYIYRWNSKYDQIFWPVSTENGLWFCETTGFISLIGDNDDMSENERQEIDAYLSREYTGQHEIEDKLILLEAIYKIRNKDKYIKNRITRILAYWYEALEQFEKANQYRKKALNEIELYLSQKIADKRRIEYYYLAANYHRQFGNVTQSDKYLDLLSQSIELNENKDLDGFLAYLQELSQDSVYIIEGGILTPDIPERVEK